MNRRDALKSVVLTPLAGMGPQSTIEVPEDAKILVFNFDSNGHLEHTKTKAIIREALDRAGLKHVEILVCQGLESFGVIK